MGKSLEDLKKEIIIDPYGDVERFLHPEALNPMRNKEFPISANRATIDYKMTKFPELQQEYTKTRILEKFITRDICALAEKTGTRMAGLEYSAKTASSVEDKLERLQNQRGLSPEKGFSKLYDLVRYTQICDHDKIFPTAKEMINELEKSGYTLMAVNNYYQSPYKTTGYKGLHMNFISPYGQVMELQVHSEGSFQAKQEGHELYEKIRAVSTPVSEKERLTPKLKQIHERVPDPPGYESLDNYQLEQQEKDELIKVRGNIDFSVKDTTEADICALMYVLTFPDNSKAHGFEVHQRDGSAVSAIQEDKEAHINTYTKDGIVTSSEQSDNLSIEQITGLETLLTAGKCNEVVSNMWFADSKPQMLKTNPFMKTPASMISSIEADNPYAEKLATVFDRSERVKELIKSSGLSPEELINVVKEGVKTPIEQVHTAPKIIEAEEDIDFERTL